MTVRPQRNVPLLLIRNPWRVSPSPIDLLGRTPLRNSAASLRNPYGLLGGGGPLGGRRVVVIDTSSDEENDTKAKRPRKADSGAKIDYALSSW